MTLSWIVIVTSVIPAAGRNKDDSRHNDRGDDQKDAGKPVSIDCDQRSEDHATMMAYHLSLSRPVTLWR
jgi:hypothetical protein